MISQTRNWSELAKTSFLVSFFVALALTIMSIVAIPLYKVAAADGKADYCYVRPEVWTSTEDSKNTQVVMYTLYQHVPWGYDRILERGIRTSEDVRNEATAFKCELR